MTQHHHSTHADGSGRHLHAVQATDESCEQAGSTARLDAAPPSDGCPVCERFVLEDVVDHCEEFGVTLFLEAGEHSSYIAVGPTSRGTWVGVADGATSETSDLSFPGGQDLVFEVPDAEVLSVFEDFLAAALAALLNSRDTKVNPAESRAHRRAADGALRRLAELTDSPPRPR